MSVETVDFLAMVRRMIRAAGKRVGDADEVELRELFSLRANLDSAIDEAIRGQRDLGRSWQAIADATGTTRQAAHARYGPRQ
ncbi:AsnC family protein [Plantibacter sp. YIM 135347]|uniref:AsnC family protein n=1 Tax=Plantibacter sp. YIM 135347 TaxID=3423919 RepID=UPI003D33B48B